MKIKYLLWALFFALPIAISQGQNIVGFWEIKEVKVGPQTMTPVAKWTKINKDGSFQSGNGWLQNAEGTWTFDKKKSLFSTKETNGLVDEFGPFTVEFTDSGMNWLREEENRIVTVTLQRISELPKGIGDKLIGLWGLELVSRNGEDITQTFDPDSRHYTFIRWDRIYMGRTPKGERVTGYWHIHGHKPEITFIQDQTESWSVEVSNTQLKMIGISDSNKGTTMTYKRLHQFPK